MSKTSWLSRAIKYSSTSICKMPKKVLACTLYTGKKIGLASLKNSTDGVCASARFSNYGLVLEFDLRVLTLVRALNPWVSCAFGNVYHNRKKRCCVREKILLGQNASNLSKCYVIFVKIGKNISLMFQIHLGMFDLIFFSQIFPQVLFSFPSSKSFFVHFLTLNAFISSSYVTTTRSTLMNFNLNLKPLVGAAIYCFMKS